MILETTEAMGDEKDQMMECLAKEGSESVSMKFDPLIDGKKCGKCSCSEKAIKPISRMSLPHGVDSAKTTETYQRPKSKQLHRFYFLKIRPSSGDLNRSAIIEEMERSIHEKKTALANRLLERKSNKDGISWELEYESRCSGYDQGVIDSDDIQIECMEQTLHELRFPNKPRPRRTVRLLCSPDQVVRENRIFGVHFTSQVGLQLCRNRYQDRMALNRIDVRYLQQAREFYSSKKPTWSVMNNCVYSPEEELNGMIESLHYRIRHGNNSLVEERKLLEEIKQAESVKRKHTGIPDKFGGSKEAIQSEIKRLSENVNIRKKLQIKHKAKIRHLKEELEAAENDIRSLERELDDINDIESQDNSTKSKYYRRKNEVHKYLFEIKKHNETLQNSCYYQYLSLLSNAKELARKKNVAALKELSHTQVEEYMSQWNNSKDFRNDYMDKNSISLGRS